jgi:hypothetical protein
MSQRIERISITLPAELVRYADREAKRLGRPRSWVIAQALSALAQGGAPAGRTLAEPVVSPYAEVAGELQAVDRRRLRAALALPPGERLRRANELVRLARAARPRRGRRQIIAFDTFEEFWQWKKAHRAAATARI